MVFRKGVKLSNGGKWWYKGDQIAIIKEYKYLGVTFTAALSWDLHLRQKAMSAKFALNSV